MVPCGTLKYAGAKLMDGRHLGRHHQVGDLLGRLGRHGEDRDLDALFFGHFAEVRQIMDADAFQLPADLVGVAIEGRGHVEAVGAEAGIHHQGLAEPSRADDDRVPLPVQAEDAADLLLELDHGITHAAPAELPEVGQVFAHLGRVDAAQLGQFPARNRLGTRLLYL